MTEKAMNDIDGVAKHIGKRVRLQGSHPWAGKAGTFVRIETISGFGERPVVELDNPPGHSVVVMRPDQWRPL